MATQKMLLVFNPVAGTGEFVKHFFEVVDRFTKGGFEVTVHPTVGHRDAYEFVRRRGGDFDYVVCSGGDGTLNEVVDAMMEMKRRPMLGYIPSGTTNDFAASHGLETNVTAAAGTVLKGVPTMIDVGQFGSEYFTYVAAFGLFADVSYATPQGMKNMFGHAAYVLEGIKKLSFIQHWACRVECDGEVLEGDYILGMITNSRSVGGFPLPKRSQISMDDGLFEVILLKKLENFSELQEVISALLGIGELPSAFDVRRASSIRFISDDAPAWSLDGEYGGSYDHVTIQVHNRAISLMTAPTSQDKPYYDFTDPRLLNPYFW